ncbi:SPOR domain-containing protein [Sphingomonas sp. LaA6.9]|uniref:SPOR domain-containing protein n=1 Tax=Sphingomonas sp. LaA6.9 TaxID=2919914 RepID=UPI001F4F8096|nr:SPOR domain-containing protein [Sphingomonas sp. LaA6.9]MCJ8157558.1 SPOR domain-containing protein [Sphingomonas sp. LaA6.9]
MNRTAVLKIAATALVVGQALVGGNPMVNQFGSAFASDETDAAASAADAAAAAGNALRVRDFDTAIAEAERAVSMSPREPAYRALLGHAYLQGGRLISAETAFGDTLALDPANGRATLSLTLVQIALGKRDLALETLRGAQGSIADADRGLALALAGETSAGLDMLESTARGEGASAKTRQNLALAHALAGNWGRARVIAAQDISPADLNQRMAGWVRFAQPENSWDQVATLLGIAPIEDSGQPARLALAPIPVSEQAYAAAAPVAPASEPEANPEPIRVAVSDAEGTLRQITFAPRQEIVQALPAGAVRADRRPVKQAAVSVPAPRAAEGGRYVVQIGAYSSASRAEAAWNSSVSRFGELSSYRPVGDTYQLNGAAVHRVALGGFESRGDAERVCGRVKAKGGSCFVRAYGNGTPAQWVQRAMGRVASR